MKRLGNCCVDCGSEAVRTVLDDMGPAFKMQITHFACGARLKSTIAERGTVVRASHSDCGSAE